MRIKYLVEYADLLCAIQFDAKRSELMIAGKLSDLPIHWQMFLEIFQVDEGQIKMLSSASGKVRQKTRISMPAFQEGIKKMMEAGYTLDSVKNFGRLIW